MSKNKWYQEFLEDVLLDEEDSDDQSSDLDYMDLDYEEPISDDFDLQNTYAERYMRDCSEELLSGQELNDFIQERLAKQTAEQERDRMALDDVPAEEYELFSEDILISVKEKGAKHDKAHEKESCIEQDGLCAQLGKSIVQPTVAEQTPQNPAPSAPPAKKSEAKKMDLFAMEQEILKNVKLIRHDGGVYYFNGKCYSAIRNDMDLLELVRRKVSTTGFSTGSMKCFQDLLTFIKTDPGLTPNNYEDKLEKARKFISLKNGVLNIHKLELQDFDDRHLLFHNIDANWTDEYPHTFMKFLQESCRDEDVVKLTTEVIGYLLSGSNLAKKFFIVGTAKDSGKTTLAELIVRLLGEDLIISIEANKLHERFALGSSRGKVLGVSMDLPKGKLSSAAVSKIKAISGLDHTSLEQKYAPVEFTRSSLRFLFGTNYPVTIVASDGDGDDAFWERLIVLPFSHSVDPLKKDVNLGTRLWGERDAIVSLCLRNYRDVYERDYVFSYCQASEDMKTRWRRGGEASYRGFESFFEDYVEITNDPNGGEFSLDLYEAYLDYCRSREIEPITRTDMLNWIDSNYGSVLGKRDRFRMGGNPVARYGYHNMKLHYEAE